MGDVEAEDVEKVDDQHNSQSSGNSELSADCLTKDSEGNCVAMPEEDYYGDETDIENKAEDYDTYDVEAEDVEKVDDKHNSQSSGNSELSATCLTKDSEGNCVTVPEEENYYSDETNRENKTEDYDLDTQSVDDVEEVADKHTEESKDRSELTADCLTRDSEGNCVIPDGDDYNY